MASLSHFLADGSKDSAVTTCTFGYVQGQLGQNRLSPRRMVQYLQGLVDHHHFPAPLPAIVKGGTLTKQVHTSSKWIRSAVHAWLDGFIPPQCAATLDDQAYAAAAMDIDANAANLRLVGGKDVQRRDHAERKSA